jgi:hypothetical protein
MAQAAAAWLTSLDTSDALAHVERGMTWPGAHGMRAPSMQATVAAAYFHFINA